ncbi:MAG: non-hydrolyzing UDP-N-acetylglucosamine 2-epimerase [Eubacteriales bacterium]|jgi:UDP-N-acetylglucosamine 2-epimerase
MGKLKLMTIVGTRPEIIRLSEVIKKCDKYFDHFLVHTGQNYDYELNQIFFEDLGLREPDFYLNTVGADLGETIGNIIAKSYRIMAEVKPDALLILGDTNSCLSAISAKRIHIPIFHMEAGNRCFDECLPEETNRRIVDHIADVNLCYTEHARRYLNYEGTAKERTFVIGSPMPEVLSSNIAKINSSRVLETLGVEKSKYILLSAHREENIDTESNFLSLMNAVNALAEKYNMNIIYSTHPRSAKFIEKRAFSFHKNVRMHKPFNFSDYNFLQMNSFCVVSDSGTLPEESSYFQSIGKPFPAVCLRTSTERPEALDKGNFILAGITTEQVLQAVEVAVEMNSNSDCGVSVPDYTDENVSSKIIKIIQSYTGVVNKMVWRKY